MGIRRKSPRLFVMAKVEALWQDDTGNPRVAPATVEDRSRGGLSIRINTPVCVGTKLIIKWQSEQFSGNVTHSRRDKAEYILGIQFRLTEGQP
jgi:PilZ domain-containing protein